MVVILIPLLLLFGSLISETTELKKTRREVSVSSWDHWKRELSIKLSVGAEPEPPLRGRVDSPNASNEKVVLVFDANAGPTTPRSRSRVVTDYSQSRYKSLAIVCSISTIIVLTIGLTVLYIHYKRGNNSSQEYLNRDGFQLNTISNNVNLDIGLDLMSGTHHMNRGVMAFDDITAQIIATHKRTQNNNNTNVNNDNNSVNKQISTLLVL